MSQVSGSIMTPAQFQGGPLRVDETNENETESAWNAGAPGTELNQALFDAVTRRDDEEIRCWIAAGADPFAPVQPVAIEVPSQMWTICIDKGCAAAQAIKHPEILKAVLPERMTGFPVVMKATSAWGSVLVEEGADVSLAELAIDALAHDSLGLLVERLDLDQECARQCLENLLWRCLEGCSFRDARDGVYSSLMRLLARGAMFSDRHCPQALRWVIPGEFESDYSNPLPLTFSVALSAVAGEDYAWDALSALLARAAKEGTSIDVLGRTKNSGFDLLQMAASIGRLDLVRLVLASGLRSEQADANGRRASEIAAQMGHGETAAFIDSWHVMQVMRSVQQAHLSQDDDAHRFPRDVLIREVA